MPWDPTRDLLTMQERLESLFGRAMPGWVPPVDLCERPDDYVLSMELPGLRREDIDVSAEGEILTIRGQRPPQSCCPERYQQLERGQGPFSRSFRFGQPIATESIVAELTEGVLTIRVPKTSRPVGRVDIR